MALVLLNSGSDPTAALAVVGRMNGRMVEVVAAAAATVVNLVATAEKTFRRRYCC